MVTERLQAVTSDLAPPFAIVDLDLSTGIHMGEPHLQAPQLTAQGESGQGSKPFGFEPY
jgi:hypothetical protein